MSKIKNGISLILFFLIFFNINQLKALENKILLKIDNQIVTTIDVYEEIKFLKTFNPEINNLSERELIQISKNSITRDIIKKIEAMNYVEEIKIEDKFLLKFIKSNYSKIGLNSIKSFEDYLNENNLDIQFAKEKIAIELIWNDIIFQKYNSKINIDRERIKEEILKNPQKKMQKELSLSEIVFDVTQKSEFKEKYEKIIFDIEQTGFKNAALIHSVSNTSSNGGLIGWIKEDNLNKNIKNEINNLEIGQYSKPIRTSAGFIILKLEDIKEYEIEFNLKDKVDEIIRFKTNEQLNQFSNIYFNKVKKDLNFDEL